MKIQWTVILHLMAMSPWGKIGRIEEVDKC